MDMGILLAFGVIFVVIGCLLLMTPAKDRSTPRPFDTIAIACIIVGVVIISIPLTLILLIGAGVWAVLANGFK